MEQHTSVSHPILKIVTAWFAAIGISSWSELAALLAAVYSLILILEWLWKRCGRLFFERRGWLKARNRRSTDKGEV